MPHGQPIECVQSPVHRQDGNEPTIEYRCDFAERDNALFGAMHWVLEGEALA